MTSRELRSLYSPFIMNNDNSLHSTSNRGILTRSSDISNRRRSPRNVNNQIGSKSLPSSRRLSRRILSSSRISNQKRKLVYVSDDNADDHDELDNQNQPTSSNKVVLTNRKSNEKIILFDNSRTNGQSQASTKSSSIQKREMATFWHQQKSAVVSDSSDSAFHDENHSHSTNNSYYNRSTVNDHVTLVSSMIKKQNNTNNLRSMLQQYDDRKELYNIDRQHRCLTATIDGILDTSNTTNNKGQLILQVLLQEILKAFNSLPPIQDNFYPIIRFDSQSNPLIEFYHQNPNSPFHITEQFPMLDMEIINKSKLIYSFVYEFYRKTFE